MCFETEKSQGLFSKYGAGALRASHHHLLVLLCTGDAPRRKERSRHFHGWPVTTAARAAQRNPPFPDGEMHIPTRRGSGFFAHETVTCLMGAARVFQKTPGPPGQHQDSITPIPPLLRPKAPFCRLRFYCLGVFTDGILQWCFSLMVGVLLMVLSHLWFFFVPLNSPVQKGKPRWSLSQHHGHFGTGRAMWEKRNLLGSSPYSLG